MASIKIPSVSKKIGLTISVFFLLFVVFSIYVYTEKQVDRANERRQASYQLADQLRHSSDELTQMARTYVATGDPRYKKYYQDILDIRDGKKPRPEEYSHVYWDMVLANTQSPRMESGRDIALLDLMRQSGFTDEELGKLAEAKANSDGLATLEFEAMRLAESVGPNAEAKRARAVLMLHDENYHQAKAAIMQPINDFFHLMDKRTIADVHRAENFALMFRILFIVIAFWAIFMLLKTHEALRAILGGSADEVHANISRIGRGDFATSITVAPGKENSVLAGLSEMQNKLQAHEIERKQAEESLHRSETKLRTLYEATSDAVMLVGEKNFLDCNKAALAMFGCATKEEFCTKHPADISPPEQPCGGDSRALADRNNATAIEKGSNRFEWVCRRIDTGKVFPVEVLLSRMELDGKIILQASVRDITARKQIELRDQALLRRNQVLMQSTSEGIHILDEQGNVIEANDAFCRHLGYTQAEMLQLSVFDFEAKLTADEVRANLKKLLNSQAVFEAVHRRKDGALVDVEVSVSGVELDGRKCFFALSRDITERKRAEEALRRSEIRLRTLYDSTSDAVMLLDEKGFFDCNRATLAMFGCATKEEFCSKHPGDLSPPEQACGTGSMMLASQMIATAMEKGRHQFEWIHQRADTGKVFPADVLLNGMELDGKTVLQATVRDITERKLAEEALLASESRFRLLVESSPFCIHEIDLEGRLQSMNRAGLDMLGLDDAGQVCGMPYLGAVSRQDIGRVGALLRDAIANGTTSHFEFAATGDASLYFKSCFIPIKDASGKVLKLMGITEDITERKQAEGALNQLKHTLDQALDSIFMFREGDFRFIYVNEGAVKQLGYTYAELMGMTPLDIKPEFTLERFVEMVEPLRDGAQASLTFETVHRHKNGHDIPVEIFLQLVRKEGAASRFMAIVRDITERKQVEDALRKLSLAVEQSPSSIVVTDIDANIEYVNRAFVKETGYSFDEAIGRNPRLLNSGRHPKAIFDEMWACLTRGEAWKGELINRRKDGSEYIESALISPVHQADGQVTHYLAIKENITERKKKEEQIVRLSRAYRLLSRVNEAIVRSRDRYELFAAVCNAAVESALFRFVWIGMLDETWVIPVCHAGVEEGYTNKLNILLDDERTGNGPTGRAIREGTHVVCQDIEHDPNMAPWRDEAIKRGYRASAAFPVNEAGGDTGAISVYAAETHFFTPDIVQLMLELATDVSFALDVFAEKQRRERVENEIRLINVELERRVLERTHQLEAANKELEAFSYSVSHDLRTPLRSIDGFSRVLSKNYYAQLDATGKDWLERVCRASQHMGHLIDDMLQLSQVTRSPLKRELVDLSKVAENVADELCKTYPERQVRFVLQQGLIVHADPGLMRAVMDNLLGNAHKYTGKKSEAEIEFGVCDRLSDIGEESAFFVRDNGAGFNMEHAHKLFGAFQRLHGANEFEGTGIGLATVQRIIHRHHGKVWAEAKEGQGATFYFTLPQKMQET